MAENFDCSYILERFPRFPLGAVISGGASWLSCARPAIYEGLLFSLAQIYIALTLKQRALGQQRITGRRALWERTMCPGQAGLPCVCSMRWPEKRKGSTARVNWRKKQKRLTLWLAANPTEGKS